VIINNFISTFITKTYLPSYQPLTYRLILKKYFSHKILSSKASKIILLFHTQIFKSAQDLWKAHSHSHQTTHLHLIRVHVLYSASAFKDLPLHMRTNVGKRPQKSVQ